MDKPTIVMSINAAWNIVNFRLGLIRGLQDAGYNVCALTPNDRFAPVLADHGICYFPIDIDRRGTSPIADLKLFANYWKILRRLRPAAYLGYTIKPNIWGSLAAHVLGIPVINNIAGLGETFSRSGPINSLVRLLYRLALARSAVIFFQNPDDRDLFVETGIAPYDRTRLLPGSGVDLTRFSTELRHSSVTQEPFSFLLVARLLRAKGIAEYVEAGRRVRQVIPGVRLRLLGLEQTGVGAVDSSEIRAWVEEGVLDFLGSAEDVRPHLAAAGAIVLPTYYPEGTPRSLLEAAATGLPIVTTDVAGCREIVRDGENGFLVPPRDVAALADAMLQMARMDAAERDEMGRKSRALAENEFDEAIVVDRYRKALSQVVG